MAELAADLKKSGPSIKLKMLEKRLSFSPSGREALSKFIKYLSAASRRGYLRLTISRTQLSAGLKIERLRDLCTDTPRGSSFDKRIKTLT